MEPACGAPLVKSVPTGTTKVESALQTIFCPAFGCRIKSEISVEIVLFASLKSWLMLTGVSCVGPILISSMSSKVKGATPRPQKVRTAEPFGCAPEVCDGSLPDVPVVPAVVTS